MKKLTILICVLAMLLGLAGVAWASPREEGTFTLAVKTSDIIEFETLPSGRTRFELRYTGTVSGYFNGTFSYEERGNVGFDPLTGEGTWRGTNHAIMTIQETANGVVSTVVVKFQGRTTVEEAVFCLFCPPPLLYFPRGFAEGSFTVLGGTGDRAGLHGHGSHYGDIVPPWEQPAPPIEFTGQFHTDP